MSTTRELRDNIVSALLVSPHFTLRTALPLLLAGLADAYGYREAALGDLGSAYSAGTLLAAFAAVLWSERYWRTPVLIGLLVGTGGLLAVLAGGRYAIVLSGFLLAGTGFGAVYSWMLSGLAVSVNPNRTLGWQWGVGTLPGMAFLYLIPGLGTGVTGVHRTFMAVLVMNALAGLAALQLPVRLARPAHRANAGTDNPSTAAAGVLPAAVALFAIYAGCTGGWSLLARVASHNGLSSDSAGIALSVAAATSCGVALWIARLGDRGGRPLWMVFSVALMTAGLLCISRWTGQAGFTLGVMLFIAVSAYTLTYCGGLIARRAQGASGAAVSAIALGCGAIVGPATAGRLFEAWGPNAMLSAAGLALVGGLWAYLRAAAAPVRR